MRTIGTLRRLGEKLRTGGLRFKRDEEGAVAIMTAATLVGAVIILGGSVDVYRFEMLRKRCQNALDRGVLAAAALNQKVEPEAMVRSYMKSAGCELPTDTKFYVTKEKGFRSIEVKTSFDLPLTFMRLAKQTEWDVPVQSKAEERERKVEISVVLDLSGSMSRNVSGKSERRIDALKPAAIGFVRKMLDTDKERELTSISLVPYANNVSLGREMFDHLATNGYKRRQEYSSCFHLESGDFKEGVPKFKFRDHVSHFTWDDHEDLFDWKGDHWKPKENLRYNEKINGEWTVTRRTWRCSPDAYAWLKRDPNAYSLTDGTNPLNETIENPVFEEITDANQPSLKGGREVAVWSKTVWNEVGNCEKVANKADLSCAEPKKATVPAANKRTVQKAYDDDALGYTDDTGSITYLSNDPDYLEYRIQNLPVLGSTATHIGTKYGYMLLDPEFKDEWTSFMAQKKTVGPDRPDSFKKRPAKWDDINTFKYLVIMTDGRINNSDRSTSGLAIEYGNAPSKDIDSSGVNKKHFESMCESAKDNNVIVFTIGFDLGGSHNSSTRKSMEDCATSRSHYFNVEDGDIGAAFDAIAASIQKLRLTS